MQAKVDQAMNCHTIPIAAPKHAARRGAVPRRHVFTSPHKNNHCKPPPVPVQPSHRLHQQFEIIVWDSCGVMFRRVVIAGMAAQ